MEISINFECQEKEIESVVIGISNRICWGKFCHNFILISEKLGKKFNRSKSKRLEKKAFINSFYSIEKIKK